MIRKIFSILILSFILLSCYHENKLEIRKPDKHISVESLTKIITDLQIAEGVFINNRKIGTRITEEYKDSIYAVIFRHYRITSEIFNENIDYYSTDPALMEKIYDKVLENLNKMQSQIENEAKEKAEKAKADTLQNDTVQTGN